ncbi:SsgA family sporulation/cell division regulator [Aquipuribacter sp. MA13-6]|uniref:SsgA family sporulation/cell division regulator n=1 Tax=unclassified Aquipuribacter TaxID=2635084 RepID=UPI003EE9800E
MVEKHKVDVDVEVTLRLVVPDAGPVPLPVSLRYVAADPYAVRALFRGGDGETSVEWVFSRELLVDGMERATGLGDVHVWPSRGSDGDIVVIALSSPDGRAVLHADADDLRLFIGRTLSVVPAGQEARHLDLDDVVSRLTA